MASYEEDLVLPGRTADLTRVLDFIETACERAGVKPDAWTDLQLATEEACANIIEHAYEAAGGEFVVRFAARGGSVYITIQDNGLPFDPTLVAKPDLTTPLEERRLGGLGLHLMQTLMDDIRFTFSQEDGNTLVMIKRGVLVDPRQDG
jgi:serine/threonine-protein kinase RsbW